MENLKQQIAYSSHWALPVLVNDKGEVFYRPHNTPLKLPLVTDIEYKLLDVSSDLNQLVSKIRMLEMKNKALEKRIEENYSSTHMEKYFSEIVIKYPDFNMVQHIITRHSKFLKNVVFGDDSSQWKKKIDEIKGKNEERIKHDALVLEVFMEYLNSTDDE
jgi:hypothetical protein